MQDFAFLLAGQRLVARPSGALFWPGAGVLVVGDLHLGRAERLARHGAGLLPPYETQATLARLAAEVEALDPATVICLGDSFDDGRAAENVTPETRGALATLASGRNWVWISGNHDPAPHGHPGRVAEESRRGPLTLRHIAEAEPPAPGMAEVSAHYHPKARLTLRGQRIARPCFLADERRVILPAFGTYTGGLDVRDPAFDPLLDATARALMLGASRITAIPRARLCEATA